MNATQINQETCRYIISEARKDMGRTYYVVAPPGYMRKQDGSIVKDGTSFTKSGPEWSEDRSKAFEFKTLRYAMIVSGKCQSSKVHPILSR